MRNAEELSVLETDSDFRIILGLENAAGIGDNVDHFYPNDALLETHLGRRPSRHPAK